MNEQSATFFPFGREHRLVTVMSEAQSGDGDWSLVRDVDGNDDEFCFRSQCCASLHLNDAEICHLLLCRPRDLSFAGVFEAHKDAWRRLWVTLRSGIGLSLLEDVPSDDTDGLGDREDFVDGELSIWAASLCLARELELSPWLRDCALPGSTILELGAGTGLPSMVAALMGTKLVVSTEGGVTSLAHLKRTIDLNRATVLDAFADVDNNPQIRVRKLWWGDETDIEQALNIFKVHASASTATSSTTNHNETISSSSRMGRISFPDIVLGADICYNRNSHEALLETLNAVLGDHSLCLFAHDHESTPMARTALRDFVIAARSFGFFCCEILPYFRTGPLLSAGTEGAKKRRFVRQPSALSSPSFSDDTISTHSHCRLLPLLQPPCSFYRFEESLLLNTSWDQASVTFVLLRRRSPTAFLIEEWKQDLKRLIGGNASVVL